MSKPKCEDCEIPLKQFCLSVKDEIEVIQYRCEKCFIYYRKIKSLITDNAELIAVGASTVVAAEGTQRGIPLFSSGSVTISIDNLNKVWIDSTINGEGVTFIYLT